MGQRQIGKHKSRDSTHRRPASDDNIVAKRNDDADDLVSRAALGLIRFEQRKRRLRLAKRLGKWVSFAIAVAAIGYFLSHHVDHSMWSRFVEKFQLPTISTVMERFGVGRAQDAK